MGVARGPSELVLLIGYSARQAFLVLLDERGPACGEDGVLSVLLVIEGVRRRGRMWTLNL